VACVLTWGRVRIVEQWDGRRQARAALWSGCLTLVWSVEIYPPAHPVPRYWAWGSMREARLSWFEGSPWLFRYSEATTATRRERMANVPLWPFGTAALVVSALAWRSWRVSVRPWRCRGCGYDRRGLPEGAACPECATAITARGSG
jgi:hypothetical protein